MAAVHTTPQTPIHSPLSFVHPSPDSPWGTYLSQVDRVVPYLGHLAKWAETLRRPKRALRCCCQVCCSCSDKLCGKLRAR